MYLSQLSLVNFRNFSRLTLDMPRHVAILEGANAQGKTNFLEAVYYLAAAKSPYATSDNQLVHWLADQDVMPHARVEAELVRGEARVRIEIILAPKENGQPGYRKHVRINGIAKRVMDLLGQANVVLFVPQDLSLVDGPPSRRRRYLDATLCQIDPSYCRALSRYNRIVEQRNSLLRTLREGRTSAGKWDEQLIIWDEPLTETGGQIIARRQKTLVELERLAQPVHRDLSAGQERLHLRYLPSFDPRQAEGKSPQLSFDLELAPPISLPQEPEEIRLAFLDLLQNSRREEVQRGMTLTGPHRDDMRFYDGTIDLHTYGSRGQQRTAVLALKLAEVGLMAQTTGEQPILLLDEVMSELDVDRRHYLCQRLNQVDQALITTTDLDDLTPEVLSGASVYRVSQGHLRQVAGEG